MTDDAAPRPLAVGPRARRLASALAIAAALAAAAPARAGLDAFTCYRSRTAAGTPKFVPRPGIGVADRFGARTLIAFAHERLCAPADVAGADPGAPSHPDHLTGYQIRKPVPHFARQHGLTVADRFGTLSVDLTKPARLLVPAAKSLDAPPPAPPAPAVDHFVCYKLRLSAGAARFVPVPGVALADQLGTRAVDVRKPKTLCVPADKNGEAPGAESHPDLLVCYALKAAAGAAPFAPVSPVLTADQLGPLALTVRKPMELCVPASPAP
jgi:hypothetical protein